MTTQAKNRLRVGLTYDLVDRLEPVLGFKVSPERAWVIFRACMGALVYRLTSDLIVHEDPDRTFITVRGIGRFYTRRGMNRFGRRSTLSPQIRFKFCRSLRERYEAVFRTANNTQGAKEP